jgi:outer membrane protein OmpA-like peptidoglycan-associated protein
MPKMRIMKFAGLAVALAGIMVAPLFAQEDVPGSKDPTLFTRMPGYFIESFTQKDFDRSEFEGKDGKPVAVEGRFTRIQYRPKEGVTIPSPIQTGRNYQNAIAKIGGVVLYDDLDSGGGATTMKLVRGTEEIWVRVGIGDSGNNYNVVIVEKAGMAQVVTAGAWKSDIGATGHAAVYGIYFDTDKSVVKPESEPALKEIAKLLQLNPAWIVLVVGHTDSTGEIAHNMTLSEARAKAVMTALTQRHGVAASRLSAYGVGPLAPVASNDSEEGKAKNRRVELVKR